NSLCRSGKQGLHSSPYVFKQLRLPVIIQMTLVSPMAQGGKGMGRLGIPEQLQVKASLNVADGPFCAVKDFEELFLSVRIKIHSYYADNHGTKWLTDEFKLRNNPVYVTHYSSKVMFTMLS